MHVRLTGGRIIGKWINHNMLWCRILWFIFKNVGESHNSLGRPSSTSLSQISSILRESSHRRSSRYDLPTTLPMVLIRLCFFVGASYTGFSWQCAPLRVLCGSPCIPPLNEIKRDLLVFGGVQGCIVALNHFGRGTK